MPVTVKVEKVNPMVEVMYYENILLTAWARKDCGAVSGSPPMAV